MADSIISIDAWQRTDSIMEEKVSNNLPFVMFDLQLCVNKIHQWVTYDEGDPTPRVLDWIDEPTTIKCYFSVANLLTSELSHVRQISNMLSNFNISMDIQPDIIPRVRACLSQIASEESNAGCMLLPVTVLIDIVIRIPSNEDQVYDVLCDDYNSSDYYSSDDGDGDMSSNPAVIETLQMVPFMVGGSNSPRNDCVICCDELVAGTEVASLPCNHIFHGGCINKWLSSSNLCPLCRSQILPARND